MEFILDSFFDIFEVPHLSLKRPKWIQRPTSSFMMYIFMCIYFLVTAGVIYDVIMEPPSIGSSIDEHGHARPVAFMPFRINGQYIMEGIAASYMFSLGGLGFGILYKSITTEPEITPASVNMLLIGIGLVFILVAVFICNVFMIIKLPGYLR